MKRSLFTGFLILSFLPSVLYAQIEKKDSVLLRLRSIPDDTAKVFTYLEYGSLCNDSLGYDSTLFYYNKAKALSVKLHYHEGEVAWANQLLSIDTYMENLDSTERLLLHYLDTCKKYNLEKGKAITLGNLGVVYSHKGEIIKSIECYIDVANYFEKTKQRLNLAKAFNNISRLYNMQSDAKALEYAEKTIYILVQLKDTSSFAYVAALNNKASALLNQKKVDESLKCFQKILGLAKFNKNSSQIFSAYISIADIEIQRKNFNEANNLLSLASVNVGWAKSTYDNLSLFYRQALVNYELDSIDIAYKYAKKVLEQSTTLNSIFYLKDCYSLLSKIEERKGRFQKALEYEKLFVELNDSIVNIDIRKNFAELEAKYQAEKRDREISEKELTIIRKDSELGRKNTMLLISIAGGLFFLLFALFLFLYYKQKLIIKEKTIITLNHEREKIILKSQMEGQLKERDRISKEMHDDLGAMITTILYKTDSLINQLGKSEYLDASKVIFNATAELADRLSEVIWAINPENDTLESLGLHIRVAVAEMLDAAGINFTFHFPEEYPQLIVGGDQRRNVFLCIKESVNNSIKHSGAKMVEVSLGISDSDLSIVITDNGFGFDVNSQTQGNGLRNIRKRIENLRGNFRIEVENGTRVELNIPVENVAQNSEPC